MQTVSKIKVGSSGAEAYLQDTISNYTAFEVFAHDYDIPIGECEELGGYVNYELPACMTHSFGIRSQQQKEDQDVVVDWGDGTSVSLANIDPASGRYALSHTYNTVGKYTIRIYGKSYFALSNLNTDTNIMCRVFAADLPVASHLSNFSSFARYAKHILKVDLSTCPNFIKNYSNISYLFYECFNLSTATGFSVRNKRNISYDYVLHHCYALEETDFMISHSIGNIQGVFNGCEKLQYDIADLLFYFSAEKGTEVDARWMVAGCKNIYGTVPAHKLWDNKDLIWKSTDTAFYGCSDEIKSQVPVSWGGTADDSIIESSPSEKISQLQQQIQELIQRIETLEQNK